VSQLIALDIARDLVRTVRRDITTDCMAATTSPPRSARRSSACCPGTATPPDAEADAIKRVLDQMENLVTIGLHRPPFSGQARFNGARQFGYCGLAGREKKTTEKVESKALTIID
jgi:hypothetical protein